MAEKQANCFQNKGSACCHYIQKRTSRSRDKGNSFTFEQRYGKHIPLNKASKDALEITDCCWVLKKKKLLENVEKWCKENSTYNFPFKPAENSVDLKKIPYAHIFMRLWNYMDIYIRLPIGYILPLSLLFSVR